MLRSCESTNVKGDAVNHQQELQLVQPYLGWVLQCSDAQCGLPTSAPGIYGTLVSAMPTTGLFKQSKANIGLIQATEVTTI